MTTSSVPKDYLTTLDDTVTVSTGYTSISPFEYTMPVTGAGLGGNVTGTITISNGGSNYSIGAGSTISVSGAGATNWGAVSGTIGTGFTWKMPEEFVDSFPDFNRIQKMCEEYPALKIAFEKFVTTYKLVKDHYDTPEDQRPLP